jgi:hypothetical protein
MFENPVTRPNDATVQLPSVVDLYRELIDLIRPSEGQATAAENLGLPNLTITNTAKPDSVTGQFSDTASGALPDGNRKCPEHEQTKPDKEEKPGGVKIRTEKPGTNSSDGPGGDKNKEKEKLKDKDRFYNLDDHQHIKPDQKQRGSGPVNDIKPTPDFPENARHVTHEDKVAGAMFPINLPPRPGAGNADRPHIKTK